MVDVEKEHVLSVVEGCRWRIRGVDGAAERLGLRPTTLETRMAKLGIKRPAQADRAGDRTSRRPTLRNAVEALVS